MVLALIIMDENISKLVETLLGNELQNYGQWAGSVELTYR
jgi:hypothetical protein